ncbi:MAG: hypothetical protein R2754_12645 [Microthrixaceae bacterium]
MSGATQPQGEESPGPPLRRQSRTGRMVGVALVGLAVAVALVGAWIVTSERSTDHRYVIPEGTAARLDNGELIEIIPRELSFKAGDTMTVVNHDSADHNVSVTRVSAGETVTYEFPSPGRFDGACSVHPRGSVSITVT